MSDTVLPHGSTYAEVCAKFRWSVPEYFNIAVDICDRHAEADPSRVALIYEDDAGRITEHTFAEFRARSNQLCAPCWALETLVEPELGRHVAGFMKSLTG